MSGEPGPILLSVEVKRGSCEGIYTEQKHEWDKKIICFMVVQNSHILFYSGLLKSNICLIPSLIFCVSENNLLVVKTGAVNATSQFLSMEERTVLVPNVKKRKRTMS